MSTPGSLQEEALKRKQKLLALKQRKDTGSNEADHEGQEPALPRPVFRSYKPKDESLKESALPRARAGNVEETVQEQLEALNPTPVIEEVDLMKLAPRKPDWDLKRDVAKKLERLEKRTQRAIAELIRERLKQSEEDLATVVSAGTRTEMLNDSDED
jgi:coiled-coil domain-containing protein 12